MPHLGTQPPTGFKTTTKQSFSGDNSTTAFTLNRASSTATDLEIFVDNIQQEPTTAYSVSGTTLTFTEAPPTGTNNVYVVNRGGDQNGLLPPQDLGTTDYIFGDDISFNSDGAVINMGADSEIKITHVADTGLNFKHTATGDDKPIILTLQTGETDIAANDVIGTINFQAPDEGTGTDAILVAAGIEAVSEGDFSSSSNATKLTFKTASSAAASETMSLSSAGLLTISDDLVIGDGKTIGSASSTDAITISSAGKVTITNAANTAQLELKSTDADASIGPMLDLIRDSGSPADGDVTGAVRFKADNDAGEETTTSQIVSLLNDASDGTEDGELKLEVMSGGATQSRLDFIPSETVFNEGSIDVDFRVESNGEANMLFVDGGNDRVGIGTTGGSGETLTVTKSGADATVRINGVASQEAALKLQGNNTVTNTFKIASEEDDSGLTIQKWNGSAYVTHIASSANGEVTKPLQPAFLAGPLTGASAQSGLAVGSDVTIILGNEIYDVNGDFASNTFTAPVTGKYHLSANITYNHFDEDSTQIQSGIKTSNRDYINQFDPDAFQEDADIITMTLTVVADMDANDTAFVFYNQTGGSAQVNVGKETTTFSGCLLA